VEKGGGALEPSRLNHESRSRACAAAAPALSVPASGGARTRLLPRLAVGEGQGGALDDARRRGAPGGSGRGGGAGAAPPGAGGCAGKEGAPRAARQVLARAIGTRPPARAARPRPCRRPPPSLY
jgi:hypothetical protein